MRSKYTFLQEIPYHPRYHAYWSRYDLERGKCICYVRRRENGVWEASKKRETPPFSCAMTREVAVDEYVMSLDKKPMT